jgi:hypothetical protein
MTFSMKTVLAAVALLTGFGIESAAAQEVRTAGPLRTERVVTVGPNRQLLRSGAWTLGVSYAPALVVAIKSERRGDDYLYYPVVGPWLDLAHRGECATCKHESVNQGLLVADGLFQGLGALQLVGSFLLPEQHTVETAAQARLGAPTDKRDAKGGIRLRLRPVRLSGGYGLQATAKF